MFSKKLALADRTENPTRPVTNTDQASWRLLIVDDEPDIHKITEMALGNVRFDGRRLEFLHAYSADEAKQILAREADIALILLDVVMEEKHAGLDVARHVRTVLGNQLTRIVLRTGQPGEAPEERVFIEYDINDYKEKTELDRRRLFTTVYSAIRAYRDLLRIEESHRYLLRNRAGLETVIGASARLFETRSIPEFAAGLLEQIASLLFIDSDSMMLSVPAASAFGDDPQHWEIVATTGTLSDADDAKLGEVGARLDIACKARKSLFQDDCFVGYFETRAGKITLIYVEGCSGLDDLGRQLLDIFSLNVTIAFENLSLEREVTDTQSEIIVRLGEVLETRSRETGNHVRRMAHLCHLIGQRLGLGDDECEELRSATPMHDIGKLAISDSILLKPGPLTEAEFALMQHHAEAGYRMLQNSSSSLMRSAALIAHQHHEHFDGGGYPRGIAGEDIHLYARIVAVADVFDALMHRRCYKPAWTLDATLGLLRDRRGSQFDPQVVDALLAMIPEVLALLQRYPDTLE